MAALVQPLETLAPRILSQQFPPYKTIPTYLDLHTLLTLNLLEYEF